MSNVRTIPLKKTLFLKAFYWPKAFLTFFSGFTLCMVAIQAPASPLAYAPGNAMDITEGHGIKDYSQFCIKTRRNREQLIRKDPAITLEHPIHTLNTAACFTPDENLLFVANIEAQNILGLHAPWYQEISNDFKKRVTEACNIMGYKNNEISRAFDHCVESRHKELMGPYEERFIRESGNYLKKRQQIAESLVVRCDASLNVKRKRLPEEMRFPVAWYNPDSRSVPNWLLEEKMNDDQWLENIGRLKLNNIMQDVLGNDCPGEMVYWVIYDKPGL